MPVDVNGVEVDKAIEVLGVIVFLLLLVQLAIDWGMTGFLKVFAFDILLFANETLETLSLCLCLMLKFPPFFIIFIE